MRNPASQQRRQRAAELAAVALTETPAPGSTSEQVPSAPDEVLDEVVREIFALGREAQLALVLSVGEVILRRFYGGDLAAWRFRGAKDVSFRKLADKLSNAGLNGMTPIYLSRAVALHELSTRLPVREWQHLTASHLRAALSVPHGQQRALLERAEEQGWSVLTLQEEIKRSRATPDGRGRPRLPAFVKTIHLLGRLLDDDDAFGDLDKVGDLDEAEALALGRRLAALGARCAELQRAIERRSA